MCKSTPRLVHAVAAVALLSGSVVLAQYQVENSSGRARDANLRLGSGGYNDTRALPNGVTSDDIVYGNVTRGQEFRGRLTSTDPRAFRGATAGRNVDTFVKDSSGVPTGSGPESFQPQRFLGDSRGVNPPPDYQRESFSTGGFVPAAPPPAGPTPGDLRLSATISNPMMDDSLFPGSPTADLTRLKALSPVAASLAAGLNPAIAGMPQWGTTQGQRDALSELSSGTLRRLNITGDTLRSMREELEKSATEGDPQTPAAKPGAIGTPESPSNAPLNSRLQSAMTPKAMTGSMDTSASVRQNLLVPLPEATLQSSQYAELKRRLKIYQDQGAMTDDQAAAQEYNQQVRLQQEQAALKTPATVTPGQAPTVTPVKPKHPGELVAPSLPHAGRRATVMRERGAGLTGETTPGVIGPNQGPVRVSSFAEGIRAPRLKAMLEGAEAAMREGKFTSALDQYDAAAAVAPNNPVILMGRANAELGAAYYARAQSHIEQIFASDQAMLMAQYDLKKFFGEERLQYLVRDLKDVAKTEPNQSRPLFLLAYIAYNTNSPQLASDYLAAAEQRGGKSPMNDKLREFWNLPEPQTQTAPAK